MMLMFAAIISTVVPCACDSILEAHFASSEPIHDFYLNWTIWEYDNYWFIVLAYVLEEQKLRKLMTNDDCEMIEPAYKEATERTLWERITKSNHEDVTYYKGLLQEYTRDLLLVMRQDFLEEITGKHIKNKAFEEE